MMVFLFQTCGLRAANDGPSWVGKLIKDRGEAAGLSSNLQASQQGKRAIPGPHYATIPSTTA
jgi:hypothetical protein